MIPYELAKQLRSAGFPQEYKAGNPMKKLEATELAIKALEAIK